MADSARKYIMIAYWIFFMIMNSYASNNTTSFNNFPVQWVDFNLINCAIPSTIDISLFTCLPAANYTEFNDLDCFDIMDILFDPNTCHVTTNIATSTIITPISTYETTMYQTTIAEVQTSINIAAVTIDTTAVAMQTLTGSQATTPNIYTSTVTGVTIRKDTTTAYVTNYSIAATTATVTTNIHTCNNNSYIGTYCNFSANACSVTQICSNGGTCVSNTTSQLGYNCLCAMGYAGNNCENNVQICTENTCWHNGTCIPANVTINLENGIDFICECIDGYYGVYCELSADLCKNIKCENNGICQTVAMRWICRCVNSQYYYGDLCQFKTKKLRILEIISKSFAYIAIIAISATCAFVIIMDILKYVFHIDPVETERDNRRKRVLAHKRERQPIKTSRNRIALRFQYVS